MPTFHLLKSILKYQPWAHYGHVLSFFLFNMTNLLGFLAHSVSNQQFQLKYHWTCRTSTHIYYYKSSGLSLSINKHNVLILSEFRTNTNPWLLVGLPCVIHRWKGLFSIRFRWINVPGWIWNRNLCICHWQIQFLVKDSDFIGIFIMFILAVLSLLVYTVTPCILLNLCEFFFFLFFFSVTWDMTSIFLQFRKSGWTEWPGIFCTCWGHMWAGLIEIWWTSDNDLDHGKVI